MSTETHRTKIIAVGDEETSLGFKLAGITESITVEPEEAGSILRRLGENPELAILIVTEEVANSNQEILRRIRQRAYPVVVKVPGKKAKYEAGEDRVRTLIKMALGIDIE